MVDREKVLKGLGIHADRSDKTDCDDCPYSKDDFSKGNCIGQLCNDALSLLKAQKSEAKWIYGEDKTGVDGWHCSECNFFEPWFYEFNEDIDFIRLYGHCPKCGRRMTSYTGKPTQERR